MTDLLRHALDTLASDVELVDLSDRVRATARRLAMRRAAAAGAGAAVLVGATIFTTARVFAPAGGDAPLPGTVEASTSCAVAEQRPPWRDPEGWATHTPQPTVDELFYLARHPDLATGKYRLVSWQPGMVRPVYRCELPPEAARNATVSPDGKWVTWVTGDGALHIADLAGRENDRILRRGVDGDQLAPAWSPDARQLIVRDVGAGAKRAVVGVVDLSDGRFTPLRRNLPDARHLVWSADGTAIAFVTPAGAVIVARPDGSQPRAVPNLDRITEDGRRITGVQSLSGPTGPDGWRWLAISVDGGRAGQDPPRSSTSNAMINGKDGKEVAAVGGVGGYAEFQAFFRHEPGQRAFTHLLRRVGGNHGIELVGGNGEYWGGGEEPPALGDFVLLGS
ncbi:hypothetical protein ACTMTJ_27125 [Phytohabitans sp. LJ34]|uniref:hypothetical protein n=1 Tax=Phytohabitans sp. LJ34 TaxID=3452217 RepID=UPI003F8BE578